MVFNLEKPIYGSFYGIWEKWLKIAKKKNLKLVVKTPQGTATYKNVSEYIKGAKKLERYYKNPDEPMIFYGKDLLPDIRARYERKKKELKEKISVMEGLKRIPHEKLEQLRLQVFGN